MPKAFIAILVVLLLARFITAAIAMQSPKEDATERIAWIDAGRTKWLPSSHRKLRICQFYAKWSDACKRIDEQALSNAQVCSLINDKFEPVRIIDVSSQPGKNPQWITDIEKKYRIFALPTLVVVDEKGEPVSSLIGGCSSLTTYRFLSRMLHNKPIRPSK